MSALYSCLNMYGAARQAIAHCTPCPPQWPCVLRSRWRAGSSTGVSGSLKPHAGGGSSAPQSDAANEARPRPQLKGSPPHAGHARHAGVGLPAAPSHSTAPAPAAAVHLVHGMLAAWLSGPEPQTRLVPQLWFHAYMGVQELRSSVAEHLRAQLHAIACSVHEALQEAGDAVLAATTVAQVLTYVPGLVAACNCSSSTCLASKAWAASCPPSLASDKASSIVQCSRKLPCSVQHACLLAVGFDLLFTLVTACAHILHSLHPSQHASATLRHHVGQSQHTGTGPGSRHACRFRVVCPGIPGCAWLSCCVHGTRPPGQQPSLPSISTDAGVPGLLVPLGACKPALGARVKLFTI